MQKKEKEIKRKVNIKKSKNKNVMSEKKTMQ